MIIALAQHAHDTYHGVSIHEYHLGLLTPIVLSWMLAVALGRLLGVWVVVVMLILTMNVLVDDPYLGLVSALWAVFAVAGWRAPDVVRWFAGS